MRCPKCGSLEDKVIDSRVSKDGASIRRRRECIVCEYRFTTYEEIERADIRVIKRDGRGEPFDRHKILAGMTKACEKRPVSITRYASVYRQFQDIGEFISEIQSLARKIKDGTHQPELFKINGGAAS